MTVPMRMGVLWDTDLDGMPDEIPPGGNVLGLTEDLDDDNDNVDDMTEIECDSDPLDAEDIENLAEDLGYDILAETLKENRLDNS